MKGKRKNVIVRIAAVLIALCMVSTIFTAAFVSAEPVDDTSAESTLAESTDAESESTETPETETEETDLSIDDETELTEETSSESTAEDEEKDGTDVINYIFIDQENITRPDTQRIAISAGADDAVIADAKLTFGMKGSEEATEIEATTTSGNAAVFEISCDEGSNTGVYHLQKFSCMIGEEEFVSDFDVQNLVYEYGVEDDSAATVADAYVVEKSDEEDSIDLASADDEDVSDLVAEDSTEIVGALEAAEEEAGAEEIDMASGVVICLDPGHDETHSGAQSGSLKEEVLTLKIAQYLKAALEEYEGVTVYMTRSSGSCPVGGDANSECLLYRPTYAKNVGADAFISLHIDAAGVSTANGATICVPSTNYRAELAAESQALGQKILDQLVALGLRDRGFDIRYGDETYPDGSTTDYLSVIRNSKLLGIRGILVEHGFIDGTADQQYLNNEAGLKSLAEADARGIAEYFGLGESSYYADVFDADYYWTNNKELQSVYKKGDTAALLHHFIEWGMSAGLRASEEFDVDYYMEQHPDLISTYGTSDLKGYYLHYIRWGKAAGWAGSAESASGSTDTDTDTDSSAEKVTTQGGVDYSAVYDPDYYWESNKAILQKAYKSTDYAALLNHFVLWGMDAGLRASDEFNVYAYMNRYTELQEVYGNTLKGYYLHYIRWGKDAGLDATGNDTSRSSSSTSSEKVTSQGGMDYADVYDADYYWENNKAVLQNAYKSTDYKALLNHFVLWGMDAGLQAKEDFNVQAYKTRYASDLLSVYGSNLKAYYLHYIRWGKAAGWSGLADDSSDSSSDSSSTDADKVTVEGGFDYALVYDADYYWENNKSLLQGAYKSTDYKALLHHFVMWGMDAGLQASADFDVQYYKNRYSSELKSVYGDNLKAYYLHYIRWGAAANWIGTADDDTTPVTVLDDIDYSAVYDYDYYLENHPEVSSEVGTNSLAVLRHFVNKGIPSGLQGNEEFNVYAYRAAYPELRTVYGGTLRGYYLHYIWWGKEGGLVGNSDATWTPVTELNGIDYSSVYDYDYYLNNDADAAAYAGKDETEVLKHFVNVGMLHGVQGSAEFDPVYYANHYPDLAKTYGSNWKGYYLHYIWWGKAAGLQGNSSDEMDVSSIDTSYSIMGTSATTVAQMKNFYNAHADYPSYYATTDAPTIQDFCQIVYDEANAEGVRAEVVMAQAMEETGFLAYGGDVDISQFNFCGLGATGGVSGNSFDTVQLGIRAQVQHLKAYASTEALNNAQVDPRFTYVTRGSATTLAALSGKWASNTSYGENLAAIIRTILTT